MLPNHQSRQDELLSPAELAKRWKVSRSTAQRIVQREGLTRIYLGTGRNGTIRYPLNEIRAFEQSRSLR